MKLTRRQFNRAAVGAGLTWTVGGLLTSCGDDGGNLRLKREGGRRMISRTAQS